MSQRPVDDASLADAIARADGDAARELYRRHCHAILRFAITMTNNRAAAEDIVHDTFVEFLHCPSNYDPARGSLRAFLCGIARHRIASSARRARVLPVELNDDEVYPLTQMRTEPHELVANPQGTLEDPTLEDQTERAQELELLRTAITALPLVYREVIALCDLKEVPYASVADILGCPIGTVRSRLHRARALLSKTFRALLCQGPAAGCEANPDTTACPIRPDTDLAATLKGGTP
jgi:RNA polymerase sigma-70 factor (ECF subfamily)